MEHSPQIQPLDVSHLPELNRLFTGVFGVQRKPEMWEWKYFCNPHGDPVATVATLGGAVIGFYGLLPRKIRIENRMTIAYQEVDLMVDRDHGGGGLFKKLGRASYARVQELGHPFTFGFPNTTSLPLGRRILGWRAIRPIPLWTVLLQPGSMLRQRFPHMPVVGIAADRFFRMYHAFRLRSRYSGTIREAETIPVLDVSDGDTSRHFTFIRDRDYLVWRYHAHPEITYRFFVAERDERPDASVVVAVTEDGRVNICECLLSFPWNVVPLAALFARIAAVCRGEGCHTLRCWALEGSPEGRMLGSMGFFGRNALNFHVIRSFESPEFNRYLFDADRWFISSGDSDCV
ncbi:MAG TPA: GNAT family N-acetyltransferase [bacterium]|nr:GNAT family N-acetyltransferase [bacterium]